MNKEEYLSAVWERIGRLAPEDIRRSLDYYSEMIDDRMESDHLTEAQAVAAMPTVEEAAAQILADTPILPPVTLPEPEPATETAAPTPDRARPRRGWRIWGIILLILGSPLWLPLVITVGVLVLVAYILVWVAVLVVIVVAFAFGANCAAWIVYGVVQLVTLGIAQALFYIGGALLCGGLLLLLLPVCKWAVKGAVWLVKLPFRRRGA